MIQKQSTLTIAIATALGLSANAFAETDDNALEELMVVGKSVSYANNAISREMVSQQSNMTSVLAVIDNLPGVLINEGDTFGSDDWSTTVSIRGFQLSLDAQQIGITIDGIANGNSNYGGGAKANRYIDTENMLGVEVSQGTADIASRSNEALGGTLNFTTINPGEEEKLVLSYSTGDFDAQKYYARYETGEIAQDTYAWLSIASSENSDWVNQTAQNTHDHFAGKIISRVGNIDLTAYASYDDTHEDNYQRVTLDQFNQNPNWDRLTGDWTGVPYIDQLYRRGWSTLRENTFAYLQADFQISSVEFSTNIYYHNNEGRGDWLPPYVVDVVDDGEGQPNSELISGTSYRGGNNVGQLYFVDANGVALSPSEGCQSAISFPYGGAESISDPACYAAGAIPVGSYRHSHYEKERVGFNADFTWNTTIANIDNSMRGGLWYEDYHRKEHRDWHKIIDSSSSYYFDHTAYWTQYDREFPVETTMVYIEDNAQFGVISARLGLKKFMVDLKKEDQIGNSNVSISSDSDTLISGGLVTQLPVEGLEAFMGYAENFAAIKDTVLEADASALNSIKPETSENIDIGLRYVTDRLSTNITYYDIRFEDRLTFISPDSPDGIDFLIGTNGAYINVGGIESTGIEASMTFAASDNWGVYVSYTTNNSEYVDGTSDFPAGNTVYGSVEEMAVISLDWQRNSYIAGLSTKWVGDRWIDAANTQRADAYTVSDFYAGVSIEFDGDIEQVDLRLVVNNVFDESYLAGISGESSWIGAPRTAALNISATF